MRTLPVERLTDIAAALTGYDGLSIALSRQNPHERDLTLAEIFLALAAEVPVGGEWADTSYQNRSEISPDLPNIPILAYGPPTSRTRKAFVELAMHAGCKILAWVKDNGHAQAKA